MRKQKQVLTETGGWGFRSLFARILCFVGGPEILAFLAVGLVLLNIVSSTVTRLSENELNAKSEAAAHDINAYFGKFFGITEQLSLNSQVQSLLVEVRPGEMIEKQWAWQAMKRTMDNIQAVNDGAVQATWIADLDSSQLIQADGAILREGWEITERPWFQQMAAENKAIMTEPFEDEVTKQQIVSVVCPVFKPGTGELIGAAGVDFSLEKLGDILRAYTLGETGYYIFMTPSGKIIHHPEAENINRGIGEVDLSESFRAAVLSKTEGSLSYISHGVTSQGCLRLVGDTNWMVATGLPEAEFREDFYAVSQAVVWIFTASAAVIFLLILALSRQIVSPIKALTQTADQIADGNLEVVAKVATRDETGRMGAALNRTVVQLRRYAAYIKEVTLTLEKMANGDMRIDLQEEYAGEFASIRTAFSELSVSLNETLRTIDTAAEQVSTGAAQVAGGAQALAAGSTEQASSVEQLDAAITRIAEQAGENSAHVAKAARQVEQVGTGAMAGNNHMERLTGAMKEIELASREISHITKVIEDIAFQTNILSLNAAIEAARAGSAGKGFAVVADEVRGLAAKSAEASRKTGELIQNSVATVGRGTQIGEQTAQVLRELGTNAGHIMEAIGKIEQASDEQARAIGQIRQGLSQVSAVVQTNAATAEENSATSEEMSAQAATLREEVGKFKLDAAQGGLFRPGAF